MQSIREWFNGSRNYKVGAALYNTYGNNPELKEVFAQGESPYRMERLTKELSDILESCEVITIETSGNDEPIQVDVPMAIMREEKIPAKDDPYRDTWMPIYIEMNALRHKLRLFKTDEERGEAAHRIIDLQEECHKYWAMADYYRSTGAMAAEEQQKPVSAVTDMNKLEYRLKTVRTYVTRYTKLCNKDPLNTRTKEKLQTYIDERDLLENKLGYERSDKHNTAIEPTAGSGSAEG